MKEPEIRSLEGWRGAALDLSLSAGDLDLVDKVLCVVPELRIVAFLAQEARRRGLAYPISSAKQLVELLDQDSLQLAGHRVDPESIVRALPKEWFPLAHEGEFLSVIHMALLRCRAESTAALLKKFKTSKTTKAVKKTKKR
jgi:hypothetical protein